MADTKRHSAMEVDSMSLYKRQKLENPTMEANSAHEDSNLSDERAKEAMYGITEFVSTDLIGFDGIIKRRYTDFQVNEILPSGEVVHLTYQPSTSAAANGSKSQDHVGLLQQRSGTIKHGTVNQTPGGVSTLSKQEELRTDLEQGFQSAKPEATEGGTGCSLPSVRQEETKMGAHSGTIQPKPELSLPLSTSNVDQPEGISPHNRILATSSPTAVNMQDDETQQRKTPTRKKTKVTIRQTSRGWEEVDEEQEEQLVKKAAEDASVQQVEPTPGKSLKEEAQPARVRYEPKSSTLAQWQAFASGNSSGGVATGFQLNNVDRDLLTQYLGPDTVDALVALYERILKSPLRRARDYGIVRSAAISRETRSRIHQDIRKIFNSRLESTTNNDGSIVFTAMAEKPTFKARTPVSNAPNRDSHQKQPAKQTWEELGGDYLHFTLFKENKDTMECIAWLAKELNMKPGSFQFAGTKDRRAVTVQRVSVYRVLADRMDSAGQTLRNATVGNFEYRPLALQLGELSGNEFIVTLRDCDFHYPRPMDSKDLTEGARSIISTALENLGERGFINYFGLQRFGTFSTSTSEVGARILQGDFKAAVNAILHFSPSCLTATQTDRISRDDQARAHVIYTFKTTGHANLSDMPRRFSAETGVIRHLTRKGQKNSYLGALHDVPRNLRLMYVHAYQSVVWNVAASERWKRFGPTVVEGDLVLVDEHVDKIETVIMHYVDEDGEAIVRPAADDRAADPDDMFTRARALSKEEAESGTYTIFDIVLPTPGYDILYPANEMETFYKEFMGSERGGRLDPHDMRRKWKDISLSGNYRKLLAKPGKDIDFEIRVYDNDDEQFVETDLDRFGYNTHGNTNVSPEENLRALSTHMKVKHQREQTPKGPLVSPKGDLSDKETGGVRLSGGLYKDFKIATILKFQLGTSQYATMALRELMKLGGVKVYKADYSGGR